MFNQNKLQTIASAFELFTSKQLQASTLYMPLSDNEKITASAIFYHFNAKNGHSFPSYSTLANVTGFCRMTVIRHVKTIKDLGIIQVKSSYYICPKTKQRRQGNNVYLPNKERIRELISTTFSPVKRFMNGVLLSSVTGIKQISSKQIQNIKPSAISSFSSITAMFKRKDKGQYIDTKNGLMFKCFNDATNYINVIGYVGKRKLSSIIASAAKYYSEHEPSKVLDQAWLDDVLSTMRKHDAERNALKALIDYQHFGSETESHKFFMNGRYFANQESWSAVHQRDSQWNTN